MKKIANTLAFWKITHTLTWWSFVTASQKRNPYRKGSETDRRPHCCGGLNEVRMKVLQTSGYKQVSHRVNHCGTCPMPCSQAACSQSHCRGICMLIHVSRLCTGDPSAWAPTTLHPQRQTVYCLFLEGFPNSFISSKMFADIYSVPTFPKWWKSWQIVTLFLVLFLCLGFLVLCIGNRGLERARD